MEGLTVLPGQLVWAPESNRLPSGKDGTIVNAVELGNRPKYYVQHYSAKALSGAFGPYALDQILVFCRQLKALLLSKGFTGQVGKQSPVYLTSKADDAEEHTNACVLLGAYLVLVRGWPAEHIVKVLGKKEADRTFKCSWQKYSKNVMTVLACWEGLEVAVEHGWINRDILNDDIVTEFACSKYRSMVATYDASWLVPGKLMVAADPLTTVHDPNPDTFQSLWSPESIYTAPNDNRQVPCDMHRVPLLNRPRGRRPSVSKTEESPMVSTASGADSEEKQDTSSVSTPDFPLCILPLEPQVTEGTVATTAGIYGENAHLSGLMGAKAMNTVVDLDDAASSVETVCKEYEYPVTMNEKEEQGKSFSDFLQESDVTLMVRCNYPDEQGMPKKLMGYSADKLRQYGVDHIDIQFVDKDGGLPARAHVAAMLRAGSSVFEENTGVVLVHCKGGFGRSVVLACCLAIYTYDIPGRALLGWVRIARPGAITTVQQEEFLLSLRGRADVARFAGMKRQGDYDDTKYAKCAPGCNVQ